MEDIKGPKNRIENQDDISSKIMEETKNELGYIVHFSELLNKIDFNEKKMEDCIELDEIINHSQKAFDVGNNFLVQKREEVKENKGKVSDKDVQILDSIHTMKNNFGAFIGFCDLIKQGDLTENEFKSFSQTILDEAKKAQTVLENFNIEQQGNSGIKISEIDLHSYLGRFIAVLKKEAEQKNIEIDNQIKDIVKVMADSVKLESVLNNLISNAIKFTTPGGNIKIKSEQEGNLVKIYIEDNGVGIPKEKQANFFDSIGETTIGTGGERGTGIGIYTIGKLVKEMGGTISVESEGEGKGSRFIVTLPA